MKDDAVIFDLDGTVTDCEHRQHHVTGESPDWEAFADECDADLPHEWAIKMIELLHADNIEIIFVTGRTDRVLLKTQTWLANELPVDVAADHHLHMRPDGDWIPDEDLKERIYREIIEPKFNVLFVVDDRAKVVHRWRQLGLVCLQCAEGDF